MPNDRNFGIIKWKIKRTERYYAICKSYNVNDVVEMIKTWPSNIQSKLIEVKMKFEHFLDFSS